MIKFVEHFNVLNVKGTELSQSLHFLHRAGRSTEPSGKPWDVLEPKATSGRCWPLMMPEAHFQALIPALAFEHSAELWMQSYFIPLQAYRQSRIYFQRGVLFQSKSHRWVEETESVNFSLFLETEEPKLSPTQPKLICLNLLPPISALESPEMLPKGTSQKGLKRRVAIGLKKRISISPEDDLTSQQYGPPWHTSSQGPGLSSAPPPWQGLQGEGRSYTTGCLAVLVRIMSQSS